jgi:hypothetical protein
MRQWEKEKAVLYQVEVLPPRADSFNVATTARKHSVLNLREIISTLLLLRCELITDGFP